MNLTLPLRMLAAVAPAMAKGDSRRYLNGALIQRTTDGVVAVATDGAALVAAREALSDIAPFPEFILPRDLVLTLLKAGRKVTHFTVSTESVACGGVSYEFKPIDGKFPHWRKVCVPDTSAMAAAPFDPDVLQVPLLSAQALVKRQVARYISVVVETHTNASALFTLAGLPDGLSVAGVVQPRKTDERTPLPPVSNDLASVTRP